MKLSVLLFSFATAWHSVYGQDQSTFLRGSDVDVAMAKESGPTPSLCATILTVEGLSLNRTGEDSYIACQTLDGKQYRVAGVPNHVFEGNKNGEMCPITLILLFCQLIDLTDLHIYPNTSPQKCIH